MAELQNDPAYQKLSQKEKETREAYNAVEKLARERWENDPQWQEIQVELKNERCCVNKSSPYIGGVTNVRLRYAKACRRIQVREMPRTRHAIVRTR